MIIRSLAAVAVILLVLVGGVALLYAVRELSVPPAPSAQPSPKSATVVDCGTEQYAFGGGYDRQQRDCLAAAFAAGTPATFTSIHRATEGASLTYTAVVHGPVQVVVTFENGAVGANGGKFVYACAALERRPITDQPSRLSFAGTKCSGRGPEVVF